MSPRRKPARPKGDDHWTRRRPDLRRPWAKLSPDQLDDLVARFRAGESQSALARSFRIGRTTVWRYLKQRELV